MRPRELTLRGFRSYAGDATRIDFTDRGLVGIVGPIGSGKSSLLDAISFGLFGKTPKIERDTKSLINQRHDELMVSLAFEVDGTVWKAVRSLRRGGASQHALYRIEDGDEQPVADKARDMTAQVEAILGMDFEAFRRSVLLAQNQFSAFLDATGTDRNQVLKGVFGFDRLDAMRATAKVRLEGLDARLQVLASRRASADSDRKALAEKRALLEAADERSTTLNALRDSVSQADEVLKAAEAKVAAVEEELAALDRLSAEVPSREQTQDAFAAATRSVEALHEAETSLSGAVESVAEAARVLEASVKSVGGREALQSLGDLVGKAVAAAEHLDRERSRIAAATTAEQQAATDLASAEETREQVSEDQKSAEVALEKAEKMEAEAEHALHGAHDADRARSLRSGLVAGEACPVCGETVTEVPSADGGDLAVEEAEAALVAARKTTADARGSAKAAAEALATAGARHESAATASSAATEARKSLEAAVASAEKAAAGIQSEVAERLGRGEPKELLETVRREVAVAEGALEAARTTEQEARTKRDAAANVRERARRDLDVIRTGIVRLAGRLAADIDVGEEPSEVEEALRALREEWLARHEKAKQIQEAAAREVDAARAARTDLFEGAGMAATDDIVEIATEAGKEATRLGAEVEVLEKNLATLDELDADEQQALEQQALLQRLHADLAPSKFLEYLLDERRRVLADLASVHLETLTAGRYRFTDDGQFDMIDLAAADMVRSPVSLSGGETFLASLALALSLAEIVSREGGRLDAFFLDEGFGSLDPEHLDLAMDGIERLVASGGDRLVVVVSHVPAMQERVEDLIVLDRDPITGVTSVLAGTGA